MTMLVCTVWALRHWSTLRGQPPYLALESDLGFSAVDHPNSLGDVEPLVWEHPYHLQS